MAAMPKRTSLADCMARFLVGDSRCKIKEGDYAHACKMLISVKRVLMVTVRATCEAGSVPTRALQQKKFYYRQMMKLFEVSSTVSSSPSSLPEVLRARIAEIMMTGNATALACATGGLLGSTEMTRADFMKLINDITGPTAQVCASPRARSSRPWRAVVH